MEAIFGLIGVVVGALIAVFSPIITEWRKERVRTKNLLQALLSELECNEYAARTAKEENLPLGYLSEVFETSCYQQARAGGALANLPPDVAGKMRNAYDRILRFLMAVRKESSLSTELIFKLVGHQDEMPAKFGVAADALRQYLGASK